jgi:hypothetical protein
VRSAAAERLRASYRSEIKALLSPAQRLVENGAFWRCQHHEQQGLAIFLAHGFDRVFQLPIAVPEEMMLGSHFHIKPLLPFLEDAAPFSLLTISASHNVHRESKPANPSTVQEPLLGEHRLRAAARDA